MARFHVWGLTALALAGSLAKAQQPPDEPTPTIKASAGSQASHKKDVTCIIYPLASLGDDPGLGQWIASTIPDVIAPGTWGEPQGPEGGARQKLSYYPPGRILVICHTPAVQAKVAAFLQDLQKALPREQLRPAGRQGATAPHHTAVVPAAYSAPNLMKATDAAPVPRSSYPVPAPVQPPKHLFHFIIRYEGDGLVDTNVTSLVKQLSGQESAKEEAPKGDAKPGTASPLNQLFQFIIRYEGEGLVDANVVEFAKVLAAQNQTRWQAPTACTSCVGTTSYLSTLGRCLQGQAVPRPAAPPQGGPVSAPATPIKPAAPSEAAPSLPQSSGAPAGGP
jgi:hypothetical protein